MIQKLTVQNRLRAVSRRAGFTLVEIMLAMAVSSIIAMAVYGAFLTQQRSYLTQEQVVEMQQNIRAAVAVLADEIRMAGYDPKNSAAFGMLKCDKGQLSFTVDDRKPTDDTQRDPKYSNGILDNKEQVDIGFSTEEDGNRDGIPDTELHGVPLPLPLGRQFGDAGGYQSFAENIQAVEFHCLDEKGVVTTNADKMRAVQVSILARAGQADPRFSNTAAYTTASGATWGPFNDQFRRRLLVTTLQFRNIGL